MIGGTATAQNYAVLYNFTGLYEPDFTNTDGSNPRGKLWVERFWMDEGVEMIHLRLQSQLGKTYSLESSASLYPPNWNVLETKAGNGGEIQFEEPLAPKQSFYRVRVLQNKLTLETSVELNMR